jgi:hypothetical protein
MFCIAHLVRENFMDQFEQIDWFISHLHADLLEQS